MERLAFNRNAGAVAKIELRAGTHDWALQIWQFLDHSPVAA
jgi:hypothetical protein